MVHGSAAGDPTDDGGTLDLGKIKRGLLPLVKTERDSPNFPGIQPKQNQAGNRGRLRKHPFIEAHIKMRLGPVVHKQAGYHTNKKGAFGAPGKS